MTKGAGSPEIDFHVPEATPDSNLSARFFSDPSLTRAMADYKPNAAISGADFPMINPTFQQELAQAGSLTITSPDDNKSNPPDYRLTVDDKGQMHLEKIGDGDPLADGKLNIEIDPKDKSLQEAIKQADQNLKEYVREMMVLWQRNHPNEPHPSWWDDVLSSQPNIPADAQPLPAEPKPRPQPVAEPKPSDIPTPVQQPAPSGGGSDGGGSRGGGGGGGSGGGGSGGGFAGRGNFNNEGYYNPQGTATDNPMWTGGHDAKGAPVGPGEEAKAKDVYDFFIQNGFTPAQASGMLGNIQTESNFRTDAYNAGEGAIGICQWEGGRRTALEKFAADQGKPVTDLNTQLKFIMYEFTHSESKAYEAVKAAQTPEAAALAFQSKYERSASLGNRAANASAWYARLAGTESNTATA